MSIITPATDATRNATFADLIAQLKDQQGRKLDVVAPASRLHCEGGLLVVEGTEVILTDEGVTTVDGYFRPTAVFDEGIADKLGIPLAYVRRMRAERVDLYDLNVNGWLGGQGNADEVLADPRSFLVRLFRGDGGEGIARSMHSSKYARIDHLDVLTAALSGLRAAGVDVDIERCDLTDRRMYVRVTAPQVMALAPALLKNYRSPFSGERGADNPVLFAGIIISNSETGGGAASITPSIEVQVCKNGMTITKDAMRAVHLGSRMDDGQIAWSKDTQHKQLELITAKARDAVATFLNVDYMNKVIAELEVKAGVALKAPADDIKAIGKALAFDQSTIDGVLDHFIRGGDITAGGVLHAVTSFAQTITNADTAYEVEAAGMKALELAVAR